MLQPQEKRDYELPSSVESYIIRVKVAASNCGPVDARWAVGSDPGAFREVVGEIDAGKIKFTLGANSMKDLGKTEEEQ